MVSYWHYQEVVLLKRDVLILVVVEDGLVHRSRLRKCKWHPSVLILVVVEDGLVRIAKHFNDNVKDVLILVVVEDGLVHACCYRYCLQRRS